MNKFGILLCFLAISLSQSILPELDWDLIYDIQVLIMKGMSESTEYKCANTFANYKSKIVPILKEIWEDVRNGKDFKSAAMAHASEFTGLDEIEKNCHAMEKIQDFAGFGKAKGIQQIGFNIIQNSVELENLVKELIKADGRANKIIVLGKIFRTATGLSIS